MKPGYIGPLFITFLIAYQTITVSKRVEQKVLKLAKQKHIMRTYAKGYAAERELVHALYGKGWSVIRAPRSGRISIPSPDIVAAKAGRLVVIECKSRAEAFKVEAEQLEQLRDWKTRAQAIPYIGWKIARKGWFFLRFEDVVANNGNVGKRFLDGRAIGIDEL